jgi:hypothetical protein
MSDAPRSRGADPFTRIVQLAAVRLKFAAALTPSHSDRLTALDAEASEIVESLVAMGTDLSLGSNLAFPAPAPNEGSSADDWADAARDLQAVGHALQEAGHAVTEAAREVGHAVTEAADAVGHAVSDFAHAVGETFNAGADDSDTGGPGGGNLTTSEAIALLGLVDQIGQEVSAERLAQVKRQLVETFAQRGR